MNTAAVVHPLDAPFDFLSGLNPEQARAVQTLDGALLVLAGAGTGKTKVLTHRLAEIIRTHSAKPWEILSVTFTNKAAREMKERVTHLIGGVAESIWLGTFHALCVKLLRRHAEAIGFTPDFTILDTDDAQRVIKQICEAERLDPKQFPPRLVHSVFDRWKDRALTPDKVPPGEARTQLSGKAGMLYKQYQDRLRTLNAMDFGDLLLHTLTMFGSSPEILQKYQQQFRYILVDEYQDTNVAQYLWLRLLAQGHNNLCCVGDDDQSIYSWRGAEVENILRFEQDFPGAAVVRLEQNYRSTPHILGAAAGLIAHNEGRLGKTLWTETDAGEKVVVQGSWDGMEEARLVCDEIEALQHKGYGLNAMAILIRAAYQTREFEERLTKIGVPYRVIGGLKFYERAEIKDALGYLRLIYQLRDDLAFERIVNNPRRGVGSTALQKLHELARAEGLSLYEAAQHRDYKAPKALHDFCRKIQHWRDAALETPPSKLLAQVLDESGYTAQYQTEENKIENRGRLENLKELVGAVAEFPSLSAFLEHVALVTDTSRADDTNVVTLMTLHGAKGLEFPVVFLPGWEDGVFPNQRSLDEGNLEEERRLAYVGLTRARERAFVSYAHNRRIYNNWQTLPPSRFIKELDAGHIEVRRTAGSLCSSGGGGGHYGGGWQQPQVSRVGYGERAALSGGGSSAPILEHQPRFRAGVIVRHAKFGEGVILKVEGDTVEVRFADGGSKRIMATFL
ncbi:MAG: ATP-dependent helicase, partial [Holosporales bacterium]